MKFSAITGHEQQIMALRRATAMDKLHHAYLLVGPEGVGKQLVGQALAMAVNCKSLEEGEGCGVCGPCRKFLSGNYPDFIPVPPPLDEEEDKKRTASSSSAGQAIKIAQVRDLRSVQKFSPYEGGRRVILINDAHNMTEEASNALLKILEEPRPGNLFILVTSRPLALLPTIHSRCQTLHFGPLKDEQVAALVAQKMNIEETAVHLLASMAAGSPGKALAADLEFLLGTRRELFTRLASVQGKGALEALAVAEDVLGLEMELSEALTLLRSFYRDVAVWQATGAEGRLIHVDLAYLISNLAGRLRPAQVWAILDAIGQVEKRQRNNQNKQYAVEGLLLQIADPALLSV